MKATHPFRWLTLGAVLACWEVAVSPFAAQAADWPGWRGRSRDGHAADALPTQLETAPKALWRKPIGHGYSGVVVSGQKLVYLDDSSGQETAHCLDAGTGRELWSQPFAEQYADEFEPGPRCTPLIDGQRIYVQSCFGEFACLSLNDGKKQWGFHFRDYGMFWVKDRSGGPGAANRRGNSGSAAIAGDSIFIQIGSTNGASIAAFDKVSGKLLWKSQDDLTSYASLMTGTLGGRAQAIAVTCEGLLGLDTTTGEALWRTPFKTGANRNVLTPILDGNSVLFASYTTGLRRVTLEADGSHVRATQAWLNPALKINLSTPVLVGRHLYGHGPDKDFVCVDASTGTVQWRQSGFNQYASTVASGSRLLVLNDTGEVILLEASPARYTELGRFQACGKTFSHPAYAHGVLYTRDSRELAAWPLQTSAR
ncbi:MAG: PQQ-like beta-propeller repeat protein [Verrucomicrobiota bacterium]|nr:PQQ-like beta-propeller repeat protein [Verrucomicrobiota bacterium]